MPDQPLEIWNPASMGEIWFALFTAPPSASTVALWPLRLPACPGLLQGRRILPVARFSLQVSPTASTRVAAAVERKRLEVSRRLGLIKGFHKFGTATCSPPPRDARFVCAMVANLDNSRRHSLQVSVDCSRMWKQGTNHSSLYPDKATGFFNQANHVQAHYPPIALSSTARVEL